MPTEAYAQSYLIFLRKAIDLLQKSKTHPPQSPRGFGGKQEKLDSRTASSGMVGEGSGAFLQEVLYIILLLYRFL